MQTRGVIFKDSFSSHIVGIVQVHHTYNSHVHVQYTTYMTVYLCMCSEREHIQYAYTHCTCTWKPSHRDKAMQSNYTGRQLHVFREGKREEGRETGGENNYL